MNAKLPVSKKTGQLRKTTLQPDRQVRLAARAYALADAGRGHPDDLLTTEEVAAWMGTSDQFVELGRLKGYGPPYKRLSPRVVRYKRSDVLKWLKSHTHTSTAEYA